MRRFILTHLLLILFFSAHSQQVLVDRGIHADGLWCFPLVSDTLSYYYLSDEAKLSLDDSKNPEFSFIRYVITGEDASESENTIQKAGGGAILHFLIEYHTSEQKVHKAANALIEISGNDEIKLKGPIIFEKGNYSVISSILGRDGKPQNTLMATGSAPVLEGSKIALSFEMEPETSSLLLESFKMDNPDISIVFEMEYSGLTDAFNAQLEVDWSSAQKHQQISADAKVYFVSAEVDLLFDEFRKDNTIKLTTSGEDANMEALIDRVYTKLTDLFFSNIEPEKTPPDVKKDVVDGISKVVKGLEKNMPYRVHGAYKRKEINRQGYSKIDFSSRASIKRNHFITFNIGELYKKYGNNTQFFRTVAMDDPDFQQRQIHVGVDGTLVNEVGKMINNVTVTLKKEHEGGEQTVKEVVVNPKTMNNSLYSLSMVYGSKGDTDRLKWLNYDYRTIWKFNGGGSYSSEWKTESSSMINLFTPFKRMNVDLFGDPELLKEKGIRAAIVELSYPFFGETRSVRNIWRPGVSLDEQSFEITLPLSQDQYTYKITWVTGDGSRVIKENQDSSGIIFIDEFPEGL